jgi:hypothetical protein
MNSSKTISITELTQICISSFNELISALNYDNENIGDQFSLADADEYCSRFQLWSKNFGAHQHDSRSLDYRLQKAPDVRDQIVRLLRSLQSGLSDGKIKVH